MPMSCVNILLVIFWSICKGSHLRAFHSFSIYCVHMVSQQCSQTKMILVTSLMLDDKDILFWGTESGYLFSYRDFKSNKD